jgi:hypothetical protein
VFVAVLNAVSPPGTAAMTGIPAEATRKSIEMIVILNVRRIVFSHYTWFFAAFQATCVPFQLDSK